MTQWQRLAITPSQFHFPHITLTPEQQHYLSRVLRLRSGDRFIAIDGQKQWWRSRLEAETTGGWCAVVEEQLQVQTELPIAITLMAALPKQGFDEVVRQATELGVSCIWPVLSDRTLLKPSPQKLDRWRRIACEAAEQSERQAIPTILEPISFLSAMTRPPFEGIGDRYLCVARGDKPHLLNSLPHQGQNSMAIATGPEGGWTQKEVEAAMAVGFQSVSLGDRILRAVSAPVVALSLVAATLESVERSRTASRDGHHKFG